MSESELLYLSNRIDQLKDELRELEKKDEERYGVVMRRVDEIVSRLDALEHRYGLLETTCKTLAAVQRKLDRKKTKYAGACSKCACFLLESDIRRRGDSMFCSDCADTHDKAVASEKEEQSEATENDLAAFLDRLNRQTSDIPAETDVRGMPCSIGTIVDKSQATELSSTSNMPPVECEWEEKDE